MKTSMRIGLGLATIGAVALTACSAPASIPVVAPAPAPASAPTGQGQNAAAPADTSQTAQSLGQRSSEGGYWPVSLQLGQNNSLGSVVIDRQGFMLYRFDNDNAHPSKSNCSGTCLTQWPPVLANDTITFQNLDPSELGTVARKDGTQQVTVGGWPVYRYINDVVPGQATGQGVGGAWFAVAPDGSKAGQG
jgi:predicted lipoprotein with Yx(FWY)xxD motif